MRVLPHTDVCPGRGRCGAGRGGDRWRGEGAGGQGAREVVLERRRHELHDPVDARARQRLEAQDVARHGQPHGEADGA